MLTIFAPTNLWPQIEAILAQEERLHELITLQDSQAPATQPSFPALLVTEQYIALPLAWSQALPPYLLPDDWAFNADNLLGLIFHLLENDPKAYQYLHHHPAYLDLEYQNHLKYQLPLATDLETRANYQGLHNQAVLLHYGHFDRTRPPGDPVASYEAALQVAPDVEHEAFTARELASLWLDLQQLTQAEALLTRTLELPLSQEANMALRLLRSKIWMQQLVVPYEEAQVERLKSEIWALLVHHENTGEMLQVGLLLLDATHLASLSHSYAEALGYAKRSLEIFEDEGIAELAAQAQLAKGTLLATWAQNDQPQFYKPAVESYQAALKVFTKERAPGVFADIHHRLGVLYAEMPAENKRRAIWAGVASASFQEALEFYTKEQYPYEYASICNNFANAYTQFPPAIHSDNHVKALHYYQEALEIRSAAYPYERAITLLNYLEASWNAGNDESSFNQARFDDMKAKANEVKALVQAPEMVATADEHLKNLDQLQEAFQNDRIDA